MADGSYLERALFVVARQEGGKSTYLRSMFRDHRFGHDGNMYGSPGRVPEVHLSNERTLHILVSSPHEKNESPDAYLDKVADLPGQGRWNFAGALQPGATEHTPHPAVVIDAFMQRFAPERMRVCLLSPDHNGSEIDLQSFRSAVRPRRIEPIVIDGSVDVENNDPERYDLFLADFFDFT